MDLSLISDLDIAMEHSKREARRIAEATERNRIERIRFTGLVVDRIHEIDKTIPIVIYDQKKHADWRFKRTNSYDPSFDRIVTPWEYGYMKKYNLCFTKTSREETIPLLAEKFYDRIWLGDRYRGAMPNKKNNFYFINKFDIWEKLECNGEMSIVGGVWFNYEKRSNLIKEDIK